MRYFHMAGRGRGASAAPTFHHHRPSRNDGSRDPPHVRQGLSAHVPAAPVASPSGAPETEVRAIPWKFPFWSRPGCAI